MVLGWRDDGLIICHDARGKGDQSMRRCDAEATGSGRPWHMIV
jgi:hypothetical protein